LSPFVWIRKTSFVRWRHFITGRGRDWHYPRAVISPEQRLMTYSWWSCYRSVGVVLQRFRRHLRVYDHARSGYPTIQVPV